MRTIWLLGLLTMVCVGAAQGVSSSAATDDARKAETEIQSVIEPPYYSLTQLRQWLEREK
jgi:hypothetical protein